MQCRFRQEYPNIDEYITFDDIKIHQYNKSNKVAIITYGTLLLFKCFAFYELQYSKSNLT